MNHENDSPGLNGDCQPDPFHVSSKEIGTYQADQKSATERIFTGLNRQLLSDPTYIKKPHSSRQEIVLDSTELDSRPSEEIVEKFPGGIK